MQEVKKGWNEWTGEGVSSKNFDARVDKNEQIRKQKNVSNFLRDQSGKTLD